jgi:hypothetical protein
MSAPKIFSPIQKMNNKQKEKLKQSTFDGLMSVDWSLEQCHGARVRLTIQESINKSFNWHLTSLREHLRTDIISSLNLRPGKESLMAIDSSKLGTELLKQDIKLH